MIMNFKDFCSGKNQSKTENSFAVYRLQSPISISCMQKIRKDFQNTRIPSGFFYTQSEGMTQSSKSDDFATPPS